MEELEKYQTQILPELSGNEISIYSGQKADKETIKKCFQKIAIAFPKLNKEWFELVNDLISDFTDQKLIDATMNMIKTCKFPEPTPAELFQFDKKIKTFTYDDLLYRTNDYSPDSRKRYIDKFDRVKIGEQIKFVLKEHASYFPKVEK